MTRQLVIDYPEMFPDILGCTAEQFEQEAKWAMAVKLFEMKRLSSGMAATLIGVDRVAFLRKLADYNVPMVNLAKAEPDKRHRQTGSAAGEIWMAPNFEESLKDFEDYMP
jgi:predicted HTH domain antitoxin